MTVGEHRGMAVKDAKPLIKEKLIRDGQAVQYSEPSDVVISRSGDECVVSLTDQWFLDYGEKEWREQVEQHMKTMQFFSEDAAKKFEIALGWLNQWACSRTYGLGTHLPWDPQFLIESLSDSTIYMAYYTVAHMLQGGVYDGSKPGPAAIPADKMTRAVWDHIFFGKPYPADCGIPAETLAAMRREFEYWYPVDMRASGKDLIQNHLTFFLYNHLAMWGPEKAPRAIRANGHVLLNGEKMSKSTGNFMTCTDAVDEFSADAMRLALADAGDGLDDANFSTKTANAAILRLYTQVKWIEEVLAAKDMRSGPASTFMDRVFENQINRAIIDTDTHYAQTNYREALRTGFFELQSARDTYRVDVGTEGMNRDLLLRFIEVQTLLLAPICPHVCEHVWKLLGKPGSVRRAAWPQAGPVDALLLKQDTYLHVAAHDFRLKKDIYLKGKRGRKGEPIQAVAPPTKAVISVAKDWPEWMHKILDVLRGIVATQPFPDQRNVAKLLGQANVGAKPDKFMPFVTEMREKFATVGAAALVLTMPFDEHALVSANVDFMRRALEIDSVEVQYSDTATPGSPQVAFQ